MREPFPLSGWLVVGLLVAVALFLLVGPNSQASSHRFTVTESDPHPNSDLPGQWQYTAHTNISQNPTSQWEADYWRDSPWYWRHWNNDKCDSVDDLFPANPASGDTDVSADAQTVTVSIWQSIDSTYVCFALKCNDGTYAFARMRNLQTEAAVDSGGCVESKAQARVSPPDQPSIDPSTDPNNNDQTLDPVGQGPDTIDDPGGQGQEGPGGGQSGTEQDDANSDQQTGSDNQNDQDQDGQSNNDQNNQNDQDQDGQNQDGQSNNDQNDQQQSSTDLADQPPSK